MTLAGVRQRQNTARCAEAANLRAPSAAPALKPANRELPCQGQECNSRAAHWQSRRPYPSCKCHKGFACIFSWTGNKTHFILPCPLPSKAEYHAQSAAVFSFIIPKPFLKKHGKATCKACGNANPALSRPREEFSSFHPIGTAQEAQHLQPSLLCANTHQLPH